jgi:hypothetical protein
LFSAWAAFFTEIEHLDQLGWDSAPGVGHRTYVLVQTISDHETFKRFIARYPWPLNALIRLIGSPW